MVSVRPSQKQEKRKDKILATTGAMSENNENLLAVAWWVILNSPDLLILYLQKTLEEWQNLFYLAAGVTTFGAIVFILFGSREVQEWGLKKPKDGHDSKAVSI